MEKLFEISIWIVTITIWAYWGTVIGLTFWKRIRGGDSAGLWPRLRREQVLWLIIAPAVVAWNVFPILASRTSVGWFALPMWVGDSTLYGFVAFFVAGVGVVLYGMSVVCWLSLGSSWSMAIIPNKTSQLVTNGIYGLVRHPIYSLGIGLMLVTLIVIPTLPMLLAGCLYIVGIHSKAHSEERHLTEHFGESYQLYCQNVGRFFPNWSRRSLFR